MSKTRFIIYLVLSFYCLSACVNDTATKKKAPSPSGKPEHGSDSPITVYTAGDNKYIVFDTVKFKIPVDVNITPANVYNGIYEVRSDSLKRGKFLITKDLAFLTTFEDLGTGYRAYLYVFELTNKSLIRDTEFKHDYLYSSAGVFVIEPDNNRIFSVDRAAWYDAKKEEIIPASLYEVKGPEFKYIKNVYRFGNEVPGDTSLLSFYKNSITTGGKGVFALPDDWHQTK